MRERFLPYNLPNVGEEEIVAVAEVIRSGWISRAEVTQQFEQALADYLGVPQVVAVSSCTAALHLALVAAGVGLGHEVITTPYTMVASVEAICHAGAIPRLVDIDPETGNLDLERVERALTGKTRALLPVHFAGHPVDMQAVNDLRERYGVVVIEDAAHAIGAAVGARKVGQWGNFTAFSFYATKNLTTAEGGALVVPNPDEAERIRALSLHGMSRHAWNRYRASGSWRYDVTELGYKYNMTDIQAAMGLVQLKKLEAQQRRRAQIAQRYAQGLGHLPLILPIERPGFHHAWHLYPVRLRLEELAVDRDTIIEDLRQENIGTSVHFIPVHHHTYYRRRFGWNPGDFPQADRFFAEEVSLPLYPSMTDQDVEDVINAVARVLERRAMRWR
jgi:dTDP-4-amino-4,6-dideoxygalactose transaminase